MQNNIKALEISIEQNLGDFSQFLWQNKIPHRINESAGMQVLWVNNQEDHAKVVKAYEALCSGELVLKRVANPDAKKTDHQQNLIALLTHVPVTITLILLSILGYVLVEFDPSNHWQQWFTFYNSSKQGDEGQIWRLITPIFLHFHIMHITFNSLWVWELGKRIELVSGGLNLLGVVLLVALGSNLGQDFWQSVQGQYGPFGGMSGVVYGLLGYIWVFDKFRPHPVYSLPSGVMIFMVGWLVFCMSGVIEMFGPDNMSIANAAHLCGLIMGLILGAGHLMLSRSKSTKD